MVEAGVMVLGVEDSAAEAKVIIMMDREVVSVEVKVEGVTVEGRSKGGSGEEGIILTSLQWNLCTPLTTSQDKSMPVHKP